MLMRQSIKGRGEYESIFLEQEKSDNHSCIMRDTSGFINHASADESNHPSRHLDPYIGVRARLVNTCTNAGYQLFV
jgi:hypothetical protein